MADIKASPPAVDKMQLAAAELKGRAANVISTASELEQRLIDTRTRPVILPIIVYVTGALAILALIAFGVLSVLATRKRLARAEDRDTRHTQTSLSPPDEITNLAAGDLTVAVTVPEHLTGAIAHPLTHTAPNIPHTAGPNT